MRVDEQVEAVEVIRESNRGQSRVWRKMGFVETADVCGRYAHVCTAVLASLRRLKRLERRVSREAGRKGARS